MSTGSDDSREQHIETVFKLVIELKHYPTRDAVLERTKRWITQVPGLSSEQQKYLNDAAWNKLDARHPTSDAYEKRHGDEKFCMYVHRDGLVRWEDEPVRDPEWADLSFYLIRKYANLRTARIQRGLLERILSPEQLLQWAYHQGMLHRVADAFAAATHPQHAAMIRARLEASPFGDKFYPPGHMHYL